MIRFLLSLGVLLFAAATVSAGEAEWLKTREEGLEEAGRCSKAILYITSWKPKV